MRLQLSLLDASTRTETVILDADPEASVDAVAAALSTVRPGPFFLRGQPFQGAGRVADSGLVDGDVLRSGRQLEGDGRRAPLEACVVAGPLAGRSYPLPGGEHLVGRGRRADVRLEDPTVSLAHARLVVSAAGCTVEDLDSTNGTYVEGQPVQGATPLRPGEVLEVGDSRLEVRAPPVGDAGVHRDEDGTLLYNRPPRIPKATRTVRVVLPSPPTEQDKPLFPWVNVLAPLVLAVLVTVVLQRPEAMLFALMSPVMAISNVVTERKRGGSRAKRQAETYAEERARAEATIASACRAETADRRLAFPDPSLVSAVARGPGKRLWERRGDDPDALVLRVGVADQPASLQLDARGDRLAPPPQPVLPSVPVTVDLKEAGVVGVAGPLPELRAVGRWLVGQLAVLHSPRNLQLVLLTDGDAGEDWEWVRWLPHARLDDGSAGAARVGNDRATRQERVKELLQLLDVRTEALRERRADRFEPAVVIVFDGARAHRAISGVPRLLKEGPGVGIRAICLDADATWLPEEGRAEVAMAPDDPHVATVRVAGLDPVHGVLLDQVTPAWAEATARPLAPIRDSGDEDENVLPAAVRFIDVAQLDPDDEDEIVARWMIAGRTTEALVGVSADGPFRLDLRRDGPHALVAGTTGAGKSEFLQTLVVALAVANRPDAVNFVLVDYKGASAFADCEHLPHTVGLVTNLDTHLTQRALESLNAELRRREHALKDLRVADVDAAWERDPAQAAALGLARLVLVIDEFAELVQELPDFVQGLIRIARVGRSLGIHLIMATQRPTGVVSPEMRANTGLRVCLRMEDRENSNEVLEAPDAAMISRATPGRGFVRAGGSARLVEFQTARVAGRRRGVREGVPPPVVTRMPWERLGYPVPAPTGAEERGDSRATDLHAIVATVTKAAQRMGIARSKSPWLPPLPTRLTLGQLAPGEGDGAPAAVFGLEDLPAEQDQRPVAFDLVEGTHLIVAGSARSGRSTALRTIAGSLAAAWSPSDLHLYGLDFGNGALLPLTALPHCGAVVTKGEAERVERLVTRLVEEVARRQELLGRSGFADVAEQRRQAPADRRLPYLVVLLDRWEGFTAAFPAESGSLVPSEVLRLVREGAGAGVRLVVAGDRSALTDRLASQVEDKLLLRLSDRNDYRLADLSPRSLPEEMPPGRALRAGTGLQVQLALLAEDPSGQAQADALRRIGAVAHRRWPVRKRATRPFRVDVLPSRISFTEAWELAGSAPASSLWALLGVGGDELTAYGVDLARHGPGFVVAGPPRSGRSTALLAMARSFLTGGAAVVAICPRPSPLEQLRGHDGVLAVFGDSAIDADDVTAALDAHDGPLAVLVDDADAVARKPVDEAVHAFLRSAPLGRAAVALAGPTDELKSEIRGTVVEAKRSKAGLLFSPGSLDGDLLGLRLPRNAVGRMPPGRGVLAVQGSTAVVQVPAAD